MYKLIQDNKLENIQDILDYQSYTIRVHQLCQRFTLQSVFIYDREYRRLQSSLCFRWGTDVGHHLQAVSLLPKVGTTQGQGAPQRGSAFHGNKLPRQGPKGPVTAQGQVICIKFNQHTGCSFTACRFKHVCSVPNCGRSHPACKHEESKNVTGGPYPNHV